MSSECLRVERLCKTYPAFTLRDVSFELSAGTITGFIGRNGAGKSTTLKCLLNLVHPDSGRVVFFGQDFQSGELAVKRRIGYVTGGVSYYPRKKLRTITSITRSFYADWDDRAYAGYLERFGLDERKTPSQLSEGMKVKYALTLALSHRADLLILDEPTSGLDPVSREELLEEFLRLSREEGVTILFSTHITSDLDKCANEVLYIRKGTLAERGSRAALTERYRVVELAEKPEGAPFIGAAPTADGWSALVPTAESLPGSRPATLEDIMVHLEKEG